MTVTTLAWEHDYSIRCVRVDRHREARLHLQENESVGGFVVVDNFIFAVIMRAVPRDAR
jgi:hypothetical protein